MRRIEDVHYMTSPLSTSSSKPDATLLIRFPAQYLSEINEDEIQTTHGVIALNQKYKGPKLVHDDKIMVLGRQLEKGRFEGNVTKISAKAWMLYKEYVYLLQHPEIKKNGLEKQLALQPVQEFM